MAHILVADDVKDVRDLLRAILEQEGHEVKEAENGQQVLNYYLQKEDPQFDLILLDIGLPDFDGTQVLRKLQEQLPELPQVCFVSGEKDKNIVTKALQVGGSDYIVKPIDIVVLKNKLAKFLGSGEEEILTIEANLRATLPDLPLSLWVTLTQLSELGLIFVSPVEFEPQKTIRLVSPKLNKLLGEELSIPCLVEEVSFAKADSLYTVECTYAGMHENQRIQIRKLLLGGKKLSDKEEN